MPRWSRKDLFSFSYTKAKPIWYVHVYFSPELSRIVRNQCVFDVETQHHDKQCRFQVHC